MRVGYYEQQYVLCMAILAEPQHHTKCRICVVQNH